MVVGNIDNILSQGIHPFSIFLSHNMISSFLSFQILFKVVSFSAFYACFCSQSLLCFLLLPHHHQRSITINSNERMCFLSKNADTADGTKFEVCTNAFTMNLQPFAKMMALAMDFHQIRKFWKWVKIWA